MVTMHETGDVLNTMASNIFSSVDVLNDCLKKQAPDLWESLSLTGRRLFFPQGILQQSQEAREKASNINATIGMALLKGELLTLSSPKNDVPHISADNVCSYAPALGKQQLRMLWKNKILKENLNLRTKNIGMPTITSGLTHGLSMMTNLFVDPGDTIFVPELRWENYDLLFSLAQSKLKQYPLFFEHHFHYQALENMLHEHRKAGHHKAIVVLNFPHNPTGYALSTQDIEGIRNALLNACKQGLRLIVVCDDAYQNFICDEKRSVVSPFNVLTGLHSRLLTIKIDGVSKEGYAWGLRVGFFSLGYKFANDIMADLAFSSFENKMQAFIRGTISNASHVSQSIVLNMLQSTKFESERQDFLSILKNRFENTKNLLKNTKYHEAWETLPFHTGYFVTLKLNKKIAFETRKLLLDKFQTGIIVLDQQHIRIAFAAVDDVDLPKLFENIFQAFQMHGQSKKRAIQFK